MHFEPDNIYHIYNRGNNKIKIFFSPENYLFFLRKVRKEWLPYCDIFCYCLMPNHFHFMVKPNPQGCQNIMIKDKISHLQLLSKSIGKTLSSYTQAINLQNETTGNLFQKKTKAKCLTEPGNLLHGYTLTDYLKNCFWYIHNNPSEAGLVQKLEDWPYSSWPDYYLSRKDTLCNIQLAMKSIGLSPLDFNLKNDIQINSKIIEEIW